MQSRVRRLLRAPARARPSLSSRLPPAAAMILPAGLIALILALQPVLGSASTPHSSSFDETLTLRPLLDGHVNARFEFATRSPRSSSSTNICLSVCACPTSSADLQTGVVPPAQHHSLSPAALIALLAAHDVQSLHLSLTAGTWDHARWGLPLSPMSGGTGAELWAHMGPSPSFVPLSPSQSFSQADDRASRPDQRHAKLVHAVSGLFCASLGQALTNSFTTRPDIPSPSNSSRSASSADAPRCCCCALRTDAFLPRSARSPALPHDLATVESVHREPLSLPQARPFEGEIGTLGPSPPASRSRELVALDVGCS